MTKKIDYDSAYARLREILDSLQSEEVKIEEIGVLIKEAKELYEFCENRLRTIEAELNNEVN